MLIKNAEALERMEKIDTLVVDKTGTLTEGKPKVVAIVAAELGEDELLRLAASVERASEHPLARPSSPPPTNASLRWHRSRISNLPPARACSGKIGGKRVVLGNADFLEALGISTAALRERGGNAAPGRRHRRSMSQSTPIPPASSRSPIR